MVVAGSWELRFISSKPINPAELLQAILQALGTDTGIQTSPSEESALPTFLVGRRQRRQPEIGRTIVGKVGPYGQDVSEWS